MARALVARESAVAFESVETLPESGVTVDVVYSSLNYKDALAVTRKGRIVRRFPLVLGIDLAGTVVESGEKVLAVGQGLGETEPGGYTTRQRVPESALVPMPAGLSLEQAMQIGTAGFTAMLCVLALERNTVLPSEREIVVTGAAGGVGSCAVMLLARRGYRVAASTGRPELEEYFRSLGATSIIGRFSSESAPMQKERWGGAIDTVGGTTLANVYAQTAYGGAIACCGMAGGHELQTTVWPLILRNVSLLGVSSIHTPLTDRVAAWSRLASDVDAAKLSAISRTEPLSKIFELSEDVLAGRVQGRIAIDVAH